MPPLRGSKGHGLRWLQRCRASGAPLVGAGLGTGWNLPLPRGRKMARGRMGGDCTGPQMRLSERTRRGCSRWRRAAAPATSKPRQGRHLCSKRHKQFFSSVRSGIVCPHNPIAVPFNLRDGIGERMPPLRGSKSLWVRWLQRCRAYGAPSGGARLGTGWNLSLPGKGREEDDVRRN